MKLFSLSFLLALATVSGFCQTSHAHPRSTAPVVSGEVQVKTIPDLRPKLRAEYRVRLSPKATMTIGCEFNPYATYSSAERELGMKDDTKTRNCDGYITQSDGKTIIFDPYAIADRLLEPSLVPLVHQWTPILVSRDIQESRTRTDWWDSIGERWLRP